MNTAEHCFKIASTADKCGTLVFYLAFITSGVLVAFPIPQVESIGHPCLMAIAVLAIVCTVITTIYQTEGNRALRAAQLADGLGARTGEPIREDYYNNTLPKSVERLAATTFENTLFTKEILSRMLIKMRFMNGAYFILLLILAACRSTPSTWLVTLAQTLFSADLLLKLIRMERFRVRTARVYRALEQFFIEAGRADQPNHVAVILSAFTDYECAKDEAALPLDDGVFKKLNTELSKKWEELKVHLNIVIPVKEQQ